MTFNYPQIAAAVYQACTGYDQYLPQLSPDVAKAWAKVFERYGLTAEYLIKGVDAVYATRGNGYRPLPADIADAARSIRQSDRMAEDREVQAARMEALEAKAAEDILALAERRGFASDEPLKYVRRGPRPEMQVRCPWCKAQIGRPCVVKGAKRDQPMKGFHPSRIDAARGDAA